MLYGCGFLEHINQPTQSLIGLIKYGEWHLDVEFFHHGVPNLDNIEAVQSSFRERDFGVPRWNHLLQEIYDRCARSCGYVWRHAGYGGCVVIRH